MAIATNCGKFGQLTDDEITAVFQLTYQLIACANYGKFSEADDPSVDIMMEKMGFTGPLLSVLGNAYWNDCGAVNPFDAFDIVAGFPSDKKQVFKEAILAVARKDNTMLRMDIARQIFERTGIK